MTFIDSMEILSTGLGAERLRMNTAASNLANANTTRTEDGGPYRRIDPVFRARVRAQPFGSVLEDAVRDVEVVDVVRDPDPPRRVYDPGHPDAGEDGYVAMPNVDVVEEMVNLMTAARTYESSVTALQTVVDMAEKALQVGR